MMRAVSHSKDCPVLKGEVGAGSEASLPVARRSRIAGAALLVFLSGFTSGCYTLAPLETAPVPGNTLVMDLNDRGREALGPSIGSAATQVEGVLKSKTDSAYVLAVTQVGYLNGQSNRWTNEPLTIRSDLVRELRQRSFSRSRTTLMAGIGIGAVAALIATLSLIGSGNESTNGPPDPGGGNGQ
jgi:hypothetical protein